MRGIRSTALDSRKKDRNKWIKTIVQTFIVLGVGLLLYQAIFNSKNYVEPDRAEWANEKGFIALSYFGVDRSGTPKLVAKNQLDQQIKALSDQGYVTISQQDIVDFYQKGRKLPDKALFLSFEDGRNDSSLFAQPILEKYNYQATFLSYADKMGSSYNKFLQPKDMLKMMKSGYWELGSNGYRLSYINVFDKDGQSIGMKDENELPDRKTVAYYNHYLMDFIRDENMIPSENRSEMEERITQDYESMEKIYKDELGFVPAVYMIMHANSLNNGMNRLVSAANESNIERLFKMHFNREGNAYNTGDTSLYDLTRVQPDPYWYTNHLLMKIQKDTEQKMKFVSGENKKLDQWSRLSGAAEFTDNRIVLTSPPAEAGQLYLTNSDGIKDVNLSAKLAGNVVGRQAVYARYDREQDSFIRVSIANNELIVEQKKPGATTAEQLFISKLSSLDWSSEDLALNRASVYTQEQTSSGMSNLEGVYPVNIQAVRQLDVTIEGDKLNVAIDNQPLIENLVIDHAIDNGGVALESEYSEQNKDDDIYDGVFEDIKVSSLEGNKADSSVLFNNRYTGVQGIVSRVKKTVNATIDWTMDTF